jgi:2-polyprenyl-6-methoxyphenol hydroxylase-like FAD-dependent oxidoreductase
MTSQLAAEPSSGSGLPTEIVRSRCCVVGGGPAGMVLGLLLARAGVDTVVLEKHGDFLRDFRGDTIHPSTLEVMNELGMLDEFLQRPHQEATQLSGVIGDVEVLIADFAHLPTRCKFIAFMPQWDFLDFVANHAGRYPKFHLRMQAEATDLLEENGQIVGVRATTPQGPLEVRAELTVGADGRHSTVRARAGLEIQDLGAPIDVLWMRLSRVPTDPAQPLGRFNRGKVFVMLFRGDYWQCGFVIPKDGIEEVHRRGLEAFRAEIVDIAPFMRDRVEELRDWDQIKLLTVAVDRLTRWYRPGLLCIGDSAHAMSPVGGVGINLAIQDAVATANVVVGPLLEGGLTTGDLEKIQRRRLFPTRVTQRFQVLVQNRVIGNVIGSQTTLKPPLIVRILRDWPFARRIPASVLGLGVRPEHVRTPVAH